MIICKQCGHQNPDGTTFCEDCKAFLEWTGQRAEEPTKAGVKVLIVPKSLAVDPGAVGTYELGVQNTGSVVDSFALEIPDVTWMSIEPPEVSLFPGRTTKARIDAKPPRDPGVQAGQLRFTARATSRADPQISAEEMAVVEVGTFMQSTADLLPTTSRGNQVGNHTVTVNNKGNQAIGGRIHASDPDAALAFDITPPRFTAAPGQSASVQVAVRPNDGRTSAQERRHPFRVQIDVEGSSTPIVLDGTMIQLAAVPTPKPRRRPWALWAIVAAVVVLVAGGVVYAAAHVFSPGGANQPSTDINVSPISLDWSPQGGDAYNTVMTVHVANSSPSDHATIAQIQLQGGDPSWRIDLSSTCKVGMNLAPGQACNIIVGYLSQSNGSHTGVLIVAAAGRTAKTVSLTFFLV